MMLPARLRGEAGWSDACILNISSRGLLIYSAGRAKPGNFVEIRRGRLLVIARVVWRENQRIGLSAHDPIPLGEIICDQAVASAAPLCGAGAPVERRKEPRSADKSRARGRAAEFVLCAMAGAALAGACAVAAEQSLAKPLMVVKTALGPR